MNCINIELKDNVLLALYEATYKQLITQAAVFGLSPEDLEKYFCSERKYDALLWAEDMSTIFERLLLTLQNRQGYSRTIRFHLHKEKTKQLLFDFDVKKIADAYGDDLALERLYKTLLPVYGWKVNTAPPKLWCEGLIQGAKQLAKFPTPLHLASEMAISEGTEMVYYWMKNYPIKGMGFALSCDFLKEIGLNLAKPDVHIKGVLDSVFSLPKNTLKDEEYLDLFIDIVKRLQEIKDPYLSAYKLDKMIWLVCTNDFYLDMHEKDLRLNLIDKICCAIKN